ncbi:PAS domain-containing protein [Rozella allomycis CSF55]|uniref:PAS domain-containing protein n=1 Tax=Rozella allomycis (strain CSF55) TaxID=988480 RepID=A0A075AS81_ROZAC|nr:PAS domain-containing protein [Rozella allomycis CSF55]|eukprot:EPZ33083.1 PAS domain-containing protein [Rozella allomycis CSF55]
MFPNIERNISPTLIIDKKLNIKSLSNSFYTKLGIDTSVIFRNLKDHLKPIEPEIYGVKYLNDLTYLKKTDYSVLDFNGHELYHLEMEEDFFIIEVQNVYCCLKSLILLERCTSILKKSGIFITNHEGYIEMTNSLADSMFKVSDISESEDKNVLKFFKAEVKEFIKQVKETGKPKRQMRTVAYVPDGQTMTTDFDIDGFEICGEWTFVIRVTDTRSHSFGELEFQSVVDTAVDPILIANSTGIIQFVNKATVKNFGFEESELLGENLNMLMPSPDKEKHDGYMLNYRRTNKPKVLGIGREVVAKRKNGEMFPAELAVSEFIHDDEIKFTGILRDISEKKKAQQRILEAEKAIYKTEAEYKAKSEVFAFMSHELRTPMNGVLCMTTMLRDTPLTQEQSEVVDIIRASSENLLHVINNILDLSKIDAQKVNLEQIDFDLHSVILSVLEITQPTANKKQVETFLDYPNNLSLIMNGDPTRLRQVIMNLVGNAVKFTDKGHVCVQAYKEENKLKIIVKDTGIGIPESDLPHLFDHVYQTKAAVTRSHGGTGLGLTISQRLCQLMDGSISCSSLVNQGSTFTVEIPWKDPLKFVDTIFSKLKISKIVLFHSNSLVSPQIVSDFVKCGCVVLDLLLLHPNEIDSDVDLIIIDVNTSGIERLLSDDWKIIIEKHKAKIILMHNYDTFIDWKQFRNMGLNFVIRKPYSLPKILSIVAKMQSVELKEISLFNSNQLKISTIFTSAEKDILKRLKVLVAEDNDINQTIMRSFLLKFGINQVQMAGDGVEALELFKRSKYDLVLMDLMMPRMGGVEAAKLIREYELLKQLEKTIIIAVTADGHSKFRTPLCFIRFSYSFGFESSKRQNALYLNENTVITSSGSSLVFLDPKNLSQDHVSLDNDSSISCICTDSTKSYYAVAEKGVNPRVFIFEFPSKKLFRVLKGGAERQFSCMNFHPNGNLLATVAGSPDFMLTIWDWKQEKIVLRYKAFSQEVYNVAFSPFTEGLLTTSGSGHIKFWKMAHTFTGLKLQGQLGKFGLYELSDIYCFAEMPDGKIISGNEAGNLLIWEGGFVKCEVTMKNKKPMHQGAIRVCIVQENEVMTAGDDGMVRTWDLETIDGAETVDAGGNFEMEPNEEFTIFKDAKVNLFSSYNRFKKRIVDKVFSFHSGVVNAIDAAPIKHECVSIGKDGTLRLYDYIDHIMLQRIKFSSSGTFACYANKVISLVSGFEDGIIRVVKVLGEGIKTSSIMKPHTTAVKQMALNSEGTFLCSLSSDNEIFFFQVHETLNPIGFLSLKRQVYSVSWSVDVPNHLYVLLDNEVHMYTFPRIENIDNKLSFEFQLIPKKYNLDWMAARHKIEPPKETEGEQEENKMKKIPDPVTFTPVSFCCLPNDKLLVAINLSNGLFEVLECQWKVAGNGKSIQLCQGVLTMMKISNSFKYLTFGMVDGTVAFCEYETNATIWRSHLHQVENGRVFSVVGSFDDSMLFSCGEDGNVFVLRNTGNALKNEIEEIFNEMNPNGFSLQETKLRAKLDAEKEQAEDNVRELRNAFLSIVQENAKLPPELALQPEEFDVDPGLVERIKKKNKLKEEMKEVTEKAFAGPKKLIEKFLDPIETEYFSVKALKSGISVSTFRSLKSSFDESQFTLIQQNKENEENLFFDLKKEFGIEEAPATTIVQKEKVDVKAKREARKQLRAERAQLFQELLASKPDENYQDPHDLAAIKYAMANMGDYKLKSSSNYIVPENERINADKKKKQMTLLKESIRTLKQSFKGLLIEEIKSKNELIKKINKELSELDDNVDFQIWEPENDQGLQFEKRFEITQEELENSKKKKQNVKKKNENALIMEEKKRKIENLIEIRTNLKREIDSAVDDFDSTLNDIRKDRVLLEGDLIACEMKYLLLFKEWQLLKEFEVNDNLLADKLKHKRNEKTEISGKLNECQEKLIVKKVQVENIVKNGKNIFDQFLQLIGENNKNEEFLTKLFKRKIKRSKKNSISSTNDDNGKHPFFSLLESSDDDELDFDDDSFDEENDEDEFDENCPKDCDSEIYNQVLTLREKRLDQEDLLNEIQKSVEEKIIDSSLSQIEKEIQEFQFQKQQKLNELDIIVPLRLNQLEISDDSISQALVFTKQGIAKLKQRNIDLNQLLELEAKAHDVQMLKFGRIIDLDKLERMSTNKALDEAKEKNQQEELKRKKELEDLETSKYKGLENMDNKDINHLKEIARKQSSEIKMLKQLIHDYVKK